MFYKNIKPIQDGRVWGSDNLVKDQVIYFPKFIQPRQLALCCFTCVLTKAAVWPQPPKSLQTFNSYSGRVQGNKILFYLLCQHLQILLYLLKNLFYLKIKPPIFLLPSLIYQENYFSQLINPQDQRLVVRYKCLSYMVKKMPFPVYQPRF